MSILDITEEQIFHTLGRGKDPNYKPIETVRPVAPAVPQVAQRPVKYGKPVTSRESEDMKKLTEEVHELNGRMSTLQKTEESVTVLTKDVAELSSRVTGIQSMVKWYIFPQLALVIVVVVALLSRS
ncbi:MAG TPA: hypothetical protein HA257_05875 [Candidatus Methanoperedenaceae archaeon]|nr:hypothetical protein [Candidatus Methanoperedenaceae archaeon]